MNILDQVFWGYLLSVPCGIYIRVKSLGHLVILCWALWGMATLFSKAWCHFTLPPTLYGVLISSYPHQQLLLCAFVFIPILVRVNWYLFIGLICTFLMTKDVEHVFLLFSYLYIISGEVSIQILGQFLKFSCLFVEL